jgi:thiol-disulfide isomerase/thioredoxin
MAVDDPQATASGPKRELPVATAYVKSPGSTSGAPGILLDPRVVLVGSAVALIGVAVLAMFLWMVPSAAEREGQAACRGMRAEMTLNEALCPAGTACTLPTPAPDFTAKDMAGKDVKLSDYRGKVVLLNFWASWCNVCKTEKPGLAAMASEMTSDDFVVLTLVSDRSWADALVALLQTFAPGAVPKGAPAMETAGPAFRNALPGGTPFKMLLDPPEGDDNIGKITSTWGIKAVPESALIDRKGNIRAYFVNKRDWHAPVAQTCLRSVIDGG